MLNKILSEAKANQSQILADLILYIRVLKKLRLAER